MMIDLVEEEEEMKIQVLLGDYLNNSDTYIDMQSSSTSSPTTISSLSTSSLSHDLNDLEDEMEDIVLERDRIITSSSGILFGEIEEYRKTRRYPSTPRGPVTHPSFFL